MMSPSAIAAAVAALSLVLAAGTDKDPRDAGPDRIDVRGYPQLQQREYPIYAVKCSKCHPLARSVNAKYSAQDWKKYLKRMIRRPNSGINEEQAQAIYDFLKFHSTKQGY